MTRPYAILGGLLILFALGASLGMYAQLPEKIPLHWNVRGEVDSYGPKGRGAFLMPAVMVGMLGLFAALPRLTPRPMSLDSFRETYSFIAALSIGLLGYVHVLTLFAAISPRFPMVPAILAGMYLFFALMGNVLGRVRRNPYVGIKVPWTLASDRVWNDTHRLAARLFVACGLIGFALTFTPLWPASFAALGVGDRRADRLFILARPRPAASGRDLRPPPRRGRPRRRPRRG